MSARDVLRKLLPERVVRETVMVPGPPTEVRVRMRRESGGLQTRGEWTPGVLKGADSNRITGDWPRIPVSIDDIVFSSLRPVRARSRDVCRNHPHAKKFLRMLARHTVGSTGIGLQMRVGNPGGRIDEAASDAI